MADVRPEAGNVQIQTFNFDSHPVRTGGTPEEPLFVATDVCECLDIADVQQACDRLDEDERGRCSIPTPGGPQEVRAVTESGLYSLVLGSRKPEAKKFKRWVTHEVLPTIRKTGTYTAKPSPQSKLDLEWKKLRLQILREGKKMLSELGALDARQTFYLTDGIGNLLAEVGGNKASPVSDPPKTLDERIRERGLDARDLPPSVIGKRAKALYFERHGKNPEIINKLVNGESRSACAYRATDMDLVDQAIDEYAAKKSEEPAAQA